MPHIALPRDVHLHMVCDLSALRHCACMQPVAAAHRVGQVTQFAELVAVLQPQHLESIRYNHALNLVIRWRNTLKALESV